MVPLRWKMRILIIASIMIVYYYINTVKLQNTLVNKSNATYDQVSMNIHTSVDRCSHAFDYNWTILLTANAAYYDFFSNWLSHYQRLGINVPIIILAEDDVLYARLLAEFPPNCNNSLSVERSAYNASTGDIHHGTVQYKKLMSARPTSILKYLQEGLNVLFSDLDTVWLKNPFPYFKGAYDIWIAQEFGRIYCAGFMAIKSNNKTIKLVKDWKTGLATGHLQTNQPLFNSLLKKSDVKFKPLNETVFPPGPSFNKFNEQNRSKVVVMHNTYVLGHRKKMERFKQLNLWFQSV